MQRVWGPFHRRWVSEEPVGGQTTNIYCHCILRTVCCSGPSTCLSNQNSRAKTNRFVPRALKKTSVFFSPFPFFSQASTPTPITIRCKARYLDKNIIPHAKCSIIFRILGAFANLRNVIINLVMSVRPSVHPHGTARLPLDGFWLNLTFHLFLENLARKSSIIKIRTKLRGTLHKDVFTFMTNISLNVS
jgi:hypothetical protein